MAEALFWRLALTPAACARLQQAPWLRQPAPTPVVQFNKLKGVLFDDDGTLTEAAALDPKNPVVWGRTVLLALKGGHKQEAANALKVRCTRALLYMWIASFLNSRPRA